MLSETAKLAWRKERKGTVNPHTTRLPKQQENQKGIRVERGGGSVTRLGKRVIGRGERAWMLSMNSHGVEISITQGVEEIIRDPNPTPFYFIFIVFIMCFVLINYWEQRVRAALAMVKEKPHPPCFVHPGTREKAINPSLSGPRPTAHQPCKIRNQTPTKGAK